ncbi:MAG TPA: hypothetical protein VMF89_10400, partial [Polyangiales bacterium]|nr:hypothetical protein [Polyangiales bacterium]
LFAQDEAGQVSPLADVRATDNANALTPWVQSQLAALHEEVATCTVGLDDTPAANEQFVAGGQSYRLIVLRAGADEEKVVGALVVAGEAEVPPVVIREIAARMASG